MLSEQTARVLTYGYIVASYILAFLASIPTAWFIFHRQSALATLGIWVTLPNLIRAINSTIWREDVANRAPVWCDIASKISLIYSTGALCSCVCIAKFLAFVMGPGARGLKHAEKRRLELSHYSLCIGFPLLLIPFSFLYSPHRFGLVRTMGCEFTLISTWPAFMFLIIWGPIFGSIASVYTAYVAVRVWQTRKAKVSNNASHGSKVPLKRLFWLCLVYTTVAFPASIYYTSVLVTGSRYTPYKLHDFQGSMNSIQYDESKRYPDFKDALPLIGGLVFVVFFTFSEEMRKAYALGFKRGRLSIALCFECLYKQYRKLATKRTMKHHSQVKSDPGEVDLQVFGVTPKPLGKFPENFSIGSSRGDHTVASVSDDGTLTSRTAHFLPRQEAFSRVQVLSVEEFEGRDRPTFLRAFRELRPIPDYHTICSQNSQEVPAQNSSAEIQVTSAVDFESKRHPSFLQDFDELHPRPDDEKPRLF